MQLKKGFMSVGKYQQISYNTNNFKKYSFFITLKNVFV